MFSKLDLVFSLLQRDYTVNEGKNLTIPCVGDDPEYPSVWAHEGKNMTSNYNVIIVSIRHFLLKHEFLTQNIIQDDSFLMIIDVASGDSGLYICSLLKNSSDSSESYQEHLHAYVRVRTRPGEHKKKSNSQVFTTRTKL